ncbi:MAG TPA: 2-C-methyl-D-erythritol 4-phosphate cytidylyltransferase [Acidimicrobiales bacterium]|nr:2-C-methyl-D-erythritol 4-phosphate cytidylyltransferase [Acidimicrobiales bacterium]
MAAVVVAGGRGVRFGGLKQFAPLGEETVAARSVRQARSVADVVVLVVPPGYQGSGEGADVVAEGGATRAASVRAGLAHVGEVDVVIVHDAARPNARPVLFAAVVAAVVGGADAAVPGLVITDTVKRVAREDGLTVVLTTESRQDLMTVQTPQAFRRTVLLSAHANADEATDDAALVEQVGGRVVVVPGLADNIKITEAADLERVAREGDE